MTKKNKVYSVEGDPDYGCIYIAAPNGKSAKYTAMGTWVADHLYNPFIELRVLRCWSVKETDYDGELNIEQINELGLTWWACPDCDKEDFEIVNERTYRCKNCNKTFEIPYIQ
ncbi:hypothetical protein [uncultured Clostridium sp.]|uniref:hypothetical protein n=1 Tax=uncultured Clostridium sp. TaxID=59620 RepID=UPI0026EB8958|nr:hypothetical protein [uncultured Clostridium sp.]